MILDFDGFNKINEKDSTFDVIKRMWGKNVSGSFKERIYINIKQFPGGSFIINNRVNGNDYKVNYKLMGILNNKFDLGLLSETETNKFDISKLDDVSLFLTSLGLEKNVHNDREITFVGELSLTDLKS